MSTGLPREDAKIAFDRERRRRVLARLAARMRFEPDDVSHMLPFDEVVAALGATSRTDLGEQVIDLDSIVGTVDRRRGEFDRDFRPSPGTRGRWERIAEARKRGEAMPPIDVFRIGDLHFVRDGHHRVSVARALKEKDINARVIDVRTKLGAGRELQMADLPLKRHERVFHERVPLPPALRARIELSDEWRYAQLATLVEGWGYRVSLERERVIPRRELGVLWYTEEYEPIVNMLREAGLGGGGTETERYLRIAMLRFLLLQTHDWSDEIAEKLAGEVASPSSASEKDTMTHQIIKELRD
ncbi:hypothetical protein OJ997_06185 [Solirubrobacter phytolaccae]|uniref:Chromosome partitioning protein ParB n=1 Tax=Solirubrobacter phytolaccae TaxID=1404360 RepID=A0A9X3N944_9ACTN|nr:hypothetical protein [Solirubrobacter phytolaccae]MDA0179876.1 hypothetical protein [Solirubrobacter phytolaccae]